MDGAMAVPELNQPAEASQPVPNGWQSSTAGVPLTRGDSRAVNSLFPEDSTGWAAFPSVDAVSPGWTVSKC